jgi:hypothetical protein
MATAARDPFLLAASEVFQTTRSVVGDLFSVCGEGYNRDRFWSGLRTLRARMLQCRQDIFGLLPRLNNELKVCLADGSTSRSDMSFSVLDPYRHHTLVQFQNQPSFIDGTINQEQFSDLTFE